ncbi:hypothetical protein ACO2Q8_24035 [Larkinella sp. VNQ87]|uniref:hypothetical protein n=1 Tax=Larkinella sp. VNQ87 TaxID=3400921 RepID=UPI003C03B097
MIKRLPCKLPVILVSDTDPEIARQGLAQCDPDLFLAKPFNMQELLIKIERLIHSFSEVDQSGGLANAISPFTFITLKFPPINEDKLFWF